MDHSITHAAFRALQLTALVGSMNLACSDRAKGPSPILVVPEDRKSAVCGTTEIGGDFEPEIYVFTAMNSKLRQYPEFADAIDVPVVHDCQSARDYVAGYAKYHQEHPDFDADQELLPVSTELPPISDDDLPDQIELPKIVNGVGGVASLNNPVVRLQFTNATNPLVPNFSGKGGSCSGTFIAKNWILTAAHCITRAAVNHCVKNGTEPITVFNCEPRWVNSNRWTISFQAAPPPATPGQPAPPLPPPTVLTARAVAYVHADWIGRSPALNPSLNPLLDVLDGGLEDLPPTAGIDLAFYDRDIALLYIANDKILPPHVEEDGAKRVSIAKPQLAWNWSFYGWGRPNLQLLRNNPANTPPVPTPMGGLPIQATMRNNMDSMTCPGDSGGPIFRTANVLTNTTGIQTVNIVAGVLSAGTVSSAQCQRLPGNPVPANGQGIWTRTDVNFTFIEDTLRLWSPAPTPANQGFRCRPMPIQTGIADEVAECWGPPCDLDTTPNPPDGRRGCAANQFCSRPGGSPDLRTATCPVCANLGGGCGCVIGQCLPRLPTNAGAP